jgi:hypothetical protein
MHSSGLVEGVAIHRCVAEQASSSSAIDQLAFEHFAGGVFGQVIQKDDFMWDLVRGQAIVAVASDVLCRELTIDDDTGTDQLTQ